MKQAVYCVKDLKIGIWEEPRYGFRNKIEAIRAFELAVNENGTKFNKFPTDYAFYIIGTWDDEAGKYEMYDTPESLGVASDFIKQVASPLQIAQNN